MSVRLTIDRDIERLDVDANAPSLERDRARFPSVLTTRDPTFRLPFRVTFRHRALGGPSGGLVYALALADMLDGADHAGGRTVAATGAIEPGGGVTPVGFLPEKARAARRAHADLLLVPLSQIVDASSISGPGLAGIVSLDDARRALDRNSPRRARPRR